MEEGKQARVEKPLVWASKGYKVQMTRASLTACISLPARLTMRVRKRERSKRRRRRMHKRKGTSVAKVPTRPMSQARKKVQSWRRNRPRTLPAGTPRVRELRRWNAGSRLYGRPTHSLRTTSMTQRKACGARSVYTAGPGAVSSMTIK